MSAFKAPVAIVGVGEMGGVFARALLTVDREVLPILRSTETELARDRLLRAERVLVAVGEAGLDAVLEALPDEVRDRIALLQNELLPVDWHRHGIVDPTVAVVWFEKKVGKPVLPIRSTPIAGPWAEELVFALSRLGIPAHPVSASEFARELVLKNLYILASNLGGLATGAATVGALAAEHRPALEAIAHDVLALERARLGDDRSLPTDGMLFEQLLSAIADAPGHGAQGRSAPGRLARALERGQTLGVALPSLLEIRS